MNAVHALGMHAPRKQTVQLKMRRAAWLSAAEESSALAEILERERRLRDRNTQLLVPGKSFKRVLDFLEHAQVRSPKHLICQSAFRKCV